MHKPVFFNLTQIQMPVGALTSITHRVTGILLACGIPLSAWGLGLSLQSPQSYARLLQPTFLTQYKRDHWCNLATGSFSGF